MYGVMGVFDEWQGLRGMHVRKHGGKEERRKGREMAELTVGTHARQLFRVCHRNALSLAPSAASTTTVGHGWALFGLVDEIRHLKVLPFLLPGHLGPLPP
jgi:hypothetical protein